MLQSKPQSQCPFGSGDEDFKGFLPYIRMASISVMWPRCGEQIVVPFNYWDSIWKLALIAPVVSVKKTVEEFGKAFSPAFI